MQGRGLLLVLPRARLVQPGNSVPLMALLCVLTAPRGNGALLGAPPAKSVVTPIAQRVPQLEEASAHCAMPDIASARERVFLSAPKSVSMVHAPPRIPAPAMTAGTLTGAKFIALSGTMA